MPSNLYASIDALKDRMGIDADDDREAALTEILEGASRWVDEQTGHRFYVVSETRYYSVRLPPGDLYRDVDASERPWPGSAPARIELDDFVTVTAVATDEDGDGVYERTWTLTTDYWLGPRNAPLNRQPYRYLNRNLATGRYYFPYYEESIAVTGTAGFTTLATRPANIRELTLMVATLMARPVADLTVAGVQQYQIGMELKVTMDEGMLPDAGKRILEFYRGMQVV